jgi:U4/U6.U5 tri-snRNP-associated protein 3
MARLRAENEEEERRLAAVLDKQEEERKSKKAKEQVIQVDEKELEGLDEFEQMQTLLGFSGFSSTKGIEVEDNKKSAARGVASKNKARKYRQYMNRKGGFNRPLEKMD